MTLGRSSEAGRSHSRSPDGTVAVAFEVQTIWCDYPSAAENGLFIEG